MSKILRIVTEAPTVLIGEKRHAAFTVVTARHPTLGKLVIIAGPDGTGVVVEADE